MTKDYVMYGHGISGTTVVECGRCGQHVAMSDKAARRRHEHHHKKLDELEETTAIDPLRHDECVRIEAMKDTFLAREDLVMQARGVVELLLAEYSRHVSDRSAMMYFDDFVDNIDLNTRFAAYPGLADVVREEMDKQAFGYRPTRAKCREIMDRRIQKRERQIQSELCSLTV